MEHTDLVKKASSWLKRTFRCRVVLSEFTAFTSWGEKPDCIGWVNGWSIVVECKTSVSDFKADQKKPFRKKDAEALGSWRFYLTPPGLLKDEEIPEGWGLYEVHGDRVKFIKGVKYRSQGLPFQSSKRSEIAMLVSALARKTENLQEYI